MPAKRNYGAEYRSYHARPEQKKRRAARNTARNRMKAAGKVRKGDGMDVDHRNGNPRDNRRGNLAVKPASKNRSFPRTKTARKKNRAN